MATGLLALLGAHSGNAGEILGQKSLGFEMIYTDYEAGPIDFDGYGAALSYDTPVFTDESWGSADLNLEFLYGQDNEDDVDGTEYRLLVETTLYRPVNEALIGFLKLGGGYTWADLSAIMAYGPYGEAYMVSASDDYFFYRAGVGVDMMISEGVGSYVMAYYEDYESASGTWFFEAAIDWDVASNSSIRSSINYSDDSGNEVWEARLGYYHKF